MFKVGHKIHFAQDLEAMAILLLHAGDRVGRWQEWWVQRHQVLAQLTHSAIICWPTSLVWSAAEPAAFPPAPGSFFGFTDTSQVHDLLCDKRHQQDTCNTAVGSSKRHWF